MCKNFCRFLLLEVLFRQMVEEPVKAKATNIATTSSSREEEQVRAPIEPIRGVLVEQTFRETYRRLRIFKFYQIKNLNFGR